MKFNLLPSLALATVLAGVTPLAAQAAGSAAFSLSPSAGTYTNGSTFNVGVYENGTDVNVVTAKLSYDASKLTCLGVSGGSFANTIEASCGGGVVTISRYTAPGTTVTGSQLVGGISFKAIAGSGTAAVNFASGSQIASGGANIWNGSTAGGSYTLTTPVATTQPTPGGSISTGTGSSSSSSSSSSKATSAKSSSTPTPSASATAAAAGAVAGATTTTDGDKATTNDQKSTKSDNKSKSLTAATSNGMPAWIAWVIGIVLGTALAGGAYWMKRNGKLVIK